MKQQYFSPTAKITEWEKDVFLQASGEATGIDESKDNVFDFDWA